MPICPPPSLLSSIMHMDFSIHRESKTLSPRRADLIMFVLPHLEQFKELSSQAAGDGCFVCFVTANIKCVEKSLINLKMCYIFVNWFETLKLRDFRCVF